MSERESVGDRFVALAAAVVALVLAAGCQPPAAWMPGDAPLAMYVPDDDVWAVMAHACEVWAMTGLTCRRAPYDEDVAVRVDVGPPDRPEKATGQTRWRVETDRDLSLRWAYHVTLRPDYPDHRPTAPHEVGHLLGLWDHLPEEGTLMYRNSQSDVPTDVDLAALAEVWGVAPWEEP